MAEFTILDAPQTPGPVFAFRALKGVIFGSPTDDDERISENFKTTKQIPTLRSKISALQAPPISPSKRRKINQYASPAKSILRTPGIPTPRKQNTNVTFKDVTPSLSPELTRKGPAPREQSPADVVRDVIASMSSPKQPREAPESSVAGPKVANNNQAVHRYIAPDKTRPVSDVEAYKLATEKEMKKLVRYGQKMREYARKQDEDNTKLRIALEKLQKENEGLRKREGLREATGREEQDQRGTTQEGRREVRDAGTGRNMNLGIKDKKHSKTVGDRPNPIYTSTGHHSAGVSKASPTKNGRSSPLKRKASTQLTPEASAPRSSRSPIQAHLPTSNKTSTKERAPASDHSTARLPLDRVAAARERIRLKAELRRKTTTAMTSSPVNWDAV